MRIVIAFVLLTVPLVARAQDGGTESVFKLGAGARGISLGRAFTSLADDASAMYWNPAALKNVQRMQFMAMYMQPAGDFFDASYTYFGFVYPTLSAGAFGVGYMGIGTTFDGYEEGTSRPTGEGNVSESQILISYAAERHMKYLFGNLAVGANFKISRQTVDPFSSTAPGFDLGFRYIPDRNKSLVLGLNLQDLSGAQYKLDLAEDTVDRTILMGAGYTKHFDNGSAMRLMLQYDMPERADGSFHAGAEYAFSKFIALRAGFDDDTATFGLGVGAFDYGLDMAYYSQDVLGSTQAYAFTGAWGPTLEEKRAEIAKARAEEERVLIQKTFDTKVQGMRKRAQELEAEGDYSGALAQWQVVLEFVPDDPEATAAAAEARERLLAEQAAAVRDVENQAIIRTRFAAGLDRYNENDFLGARTEWNAILAVDPQNQGAKDYLGRTNVKIDEIVRGHEASAKRLESEGRLTEAIAEWNNVQQYRPDDPQAKAAITRLRGRIQSMSQDYSSTQRKLRIVTLYNDALQDYNAGRYQSAMTNLRELLQLQPDHADAKKLMTLCKRRTTPLSDAEKSRIRDLYLAGMQHFSKDDYKQAIVEWQKILEIDPTNESVARSIEEAQERLRKTQEKR